MNKSVERKSYSIGQVKGKQRSAKVVPQFERLWVAQASMPGKEEEFVSKSPINGAFMRWPFFHPRRKRLA